jgi:hypothetical protein
MAKSSRSSELTPEPIRQLAKRVPKVGSVYLIVVHERGRLLAGHGQSLACAQNAETHPVNQVAQIVRLRTGSVLVVMV